MATPTTRFSRLVITVPRCVAEPFGAALVEFGAAAVEQRESVQPDCAELAIGFDDDEPMEPWQVAVGSLSAAFAEQLALPIAAFASRIEAVEFDYHAAWLEHLAVVELTDTLRLAPTTKADFEPGGLRQLLFEPHPSFGDGSHPTTRLAARATEEFCRTRPGASVLDVGTGNGVLSLVAAAHGANSYGIDIDGAAIVAARHNAALNQLERRCRFATNPIDSLSEQFDLVVANLEPRTHFQLFEAIAARVSPLGNLLLTGFLSEQASLISEPLQARGFATICSLEAEGYSLLGFERSLPTQRRV